MIDDTQINGLLIRAVERRSVAICRRVERLWLRDRATNAQVIEAWSIEEMIKTKPEELIVKKGRHGWVNENTKKLSRRMVIQCENLTGN